MLTQGDALGYIMLPLQGESFETIVTQPDGLGYDILAFQAVKCTHKLRLKVAPGGSQHGGKTNVKPLIEYTI
jgi:hypothetical protein